MCSNVDPICSPGGVERGGALVPLEETKSRWGLGSQDPWPHPAHLSPCQAACRPLGLCCAEHQARAAHPVLGIFQCQALPGEMLQGPGDPEGEPSPQGHYNTWGGCVCPGLPQFPSFPGRSAHLVLRGVPTPLRPLPPGAGEGNWVV